MKEEKQEDFTPDKDDLGILEEITGKNTEGLRKLGGEEKSREYRGSKKYTRKLKALYRKYIKKSEAQTQKIKA